MLTNQYNESRIFFRQADGLPIRMVKTDLQNEGLFLLIYPSTICLLNTPYGVFFVERFVPGDGLGHE